MGIINSARSAWALIAFSNRASSDLVIEYPYGDGHMPVLKNAKHEIFAKGLAEGLTADEAYQRAGFKPNRGNAIRLKANENILKRIDEIRSRVAEKAEWTAADRLRMLADIAEKSKSADPRVAVSAIAEANKMQGSHAPSKHEHSGDISLTVSQEDAEL
ncbi:hypothetical protein WH297_03955 [Ochrobactrum vermis]|uniref:Terminase small subunit n=2 Tax=Ochrobactrum vermis TaxID=1827297 RepID=A0ABU8P9G5_9HYPH